MLTDTDLVFMRDTQKLAMPGTVVIERYALVDDGMGGRQESWTPAGTVIGRIYPRNANQGNEGTGGDQVLSEVKWWATLPFDTVVYAQDRLVFSSRSWEVLSVNNDEMWITAIRCELESENEERRS